MTITTQRVYDAWRKTPRPIVYHTNDGKGNPIETICNFIDPLESEKYDFGFAGQCAICGTETTGGFPTKIMFGDSYTDWHLHKAPESNHICPACAFTMLLNTASSRCALFRYSFVAEKTLHICNRSEMRDWILNPPEPPFVMVVAISQKKHLAIKARTSYNRETYFCMLEEECIEVNRAQAKDIITVCEALRGIGLTKEEIAKGIIRYDKIKNYRLDCIDKINHLLRPTMGSRVFTLCLFVAQKMTEEEAICYLGLTPKTSQLPPEHCSSTPSIKAETSSAAHQDMICGSKSSDSPAEPQSEQTTLGGF